MQTWVMVVVVVVVRVVVVMGVCWGMIVEGIGEGGQPTKAVMVVVTPSVP